MRGRGCAVCSSPNLEKINEQLKANVPVRTIARRLGSSSSALCRHRKHLRASTKTANIEAITESNYVPTLLDQLQEIKHDVQRIQAVASRRGALQVMLSALDRRIRLLEMQAKLSGAIDDRSVINVTTVQLDVATATKIAETFLLRHRPDKPELEDPS